MLVVVFNSLVYGVCVWERGWGGGVVSVRLSV